MSDIPLLIETSDSQSRRRENQLLNSVDSLSMVMRNVSGQNSNAGNMNSSARIAEKSIGYLKNIDFNTSVMSVKLDLIARAFNRMIDISLKDLSTMERSSMRDVTFQAEQVKDQKQSNEHLKDIADTSKKNKFMENLGDIGKGVFRSLLGPLNLILEPLKNTFGIDLVESGSKKLSGIGASLKNKFGKKSTSEEQEENIEETKEVAPTESALKKAGAIGAVGLYLGEKMDESIEAEKADDESFVDKLLDFAMANAPLIAALGTITGILVALANKFGIKTFDVSTQEGIDKFLSSGKAKKSTKQAVSTQRKQTKSLAKEAKISKAAFRAQAEQESLKELEIENIKSSIMRTKKFKKFAKSRPEEAEQFRGVQSKKELSDLVGGGRFRSIKESSLRQLSPSLSKARQKKIRGTDEFGELKTEKYNQLMSQYKQSPSIQKWFDIYKSVYKRGTDDRVLLALAVDSEKEFRTFVGDKSTMPMSWDAFSALSSSKGNWISKAENIRDHAKKQFNILQRKKNPNKEELDKWRLILGQAEATNAKMRFHTGGIAPTEQMAVLRKNERVLSPSEAAAYDRDRTATGEDKGMIKSLENLSTNQAESNTYQAETVQWLSKLYLLMKDKPMGNVMQNISNEGINTDLLRSSLMTRSNI